MNDYVTAAFQVGASFFLCMSIGVMYRDRVLKGVSIWMVAFFSLWTVYGTYNWYLLDQYWSFVTSILMGILYVIWLALCVASKTARHQTEKSTTGPSNTVQARSAVDEQ